MSAHRATPQREHDCVDELLPFFANGTLSELENARVGRHVASCPACQTELDEQSLLMRLMRTAPHPAAGASQAWARLERTLDDESHARTRDRRMRNARMWSLGIGTAAAVILLVTPTVFFDPDGTTGDYRTLTSAMPPAPAASPASLASSAIRAVFAPRATVSDIENLLGRASCEIVGGPAAHGVYTLALKNPGASHLQDALATLRASPLVALAEPVGAVAAGR